MDTKKRIWTAVRVFAALAVWFGVYRGLVFLVEPLITEKLPETVCSIINAMIIPYGVALPAAYLVIKGMKTAKSGTPLMKPGFANMAKIFVIQSGLSVSAMMPMGIIVKILDIKTPAVTAEQILARPVFYCFLLLVFAPAAEEILFRKLFFDRLMVLGTKPAVLLSAVFFALPHLISQGPAQVFYTFVLGLSFGFITARTRKLWPAMVLHSLSNLYCGIISAVWPQDKPLFLFAYVAVYVLAMPAAAVVLLVLNRRRLMIKDQQGAAC
ncbi:MAG: CPBP family intramembrane metalloprotease [Lachnospiraceae bacterium]|nr:CPBP family intramembrane metalloprotease [Lachnospiraceae bacterium]